MDINNPTTADRVAQALNSSTTTPSWRTDYREPELPAPARPTADDRKQMRTDGILCIQCLYYGLNHSGDHTVPAPAAEDRGYYNTLHDSIPSDVPGTVWESDALSRGAGA